MFGEQVTVLEARNRVGGRIYTRTLKDKQGKEQPVDLGATFVCGTSRTPPQNPIFTYAVDRLHLKLREKLRTGPATVVYNR